jgi:hypothetical protein
MTEEWMIAAVENLEMASIGLDKLDKKIRDIKIAGNNLSDFVSSIQCTCRRQWVCHRCDALEAWKAACEN